MQTVNTLITFTFFAPMLAMILMHLATDRDASHILLSDAPSRA